MANELLSIVHEQCKAGGTTATVTLVDSLGREFTRDLGDFLAREDFFLSSGLALRSVAFIPPVNKSVKVEEQPTTEVDE